MGTCFSNFLAILLAIPQPVQGESHHVESISNSRSRRGEKEGRKKSAEELF